MKILRTIFVFLMVALLITGCGSSSESDNESDGGASTDGGATDGGSTDGGTTDGGSTDGGSTDGGTTDGGSTDGGSTDGGTTDGGSTDGGITDSQVISNGDGDTDGSSFYISNNNSARLSGPVIGSSALADSSIHKQLLLTKSSSNSSLALRQAYAISVGTSGTSLVGVVQNTSQNTLCSVDISGLETRGPNGQLSTVQPLLSRSPINGSIGLSSLTNTMLSTCISQNEYAYFQNLLFTNIDNINELNFSTLEAGFLSQSFSSPGSVVVPLSYTVNGSEVTVRVANQSSSAVEVTSMALFLLNGSGFPLNVSLVNSIDTTLSPGEELDISDNISFSGSSSTIRAVVTVSP